MSYTPPLIVRWLDRQPYLITWQAMKQFTDTRLETTPDEIWLLEHDPVFTQGQNGKAEHVIAPLDIPIVQTDRGGQITYHGPGQLMAYTLIDLKRKKLHVRALVNALEQTVIDLLAAYHIRANAKPDAPGVYVAQKKICSIGLRIRKGCSYHGIAFNINMDLSPFTRINPCGFPHLVMTQIAEFRPSTTIKEVGNKLINYLMDNLDYPFLSENTFHSDSKMAC